MSKVLKQGRLNQGPGGTEEPHWYEEMLVLLCLPLLVNCEKLYHQNNLKEFII